MRRLVAAVPIIGALLLLGSVLREDGSVSAATGPCGTANDFITPAEAQMLTLVNNYRVAEFDVEPMTMSVSASKAAQWQAEALLSGQASGHTDIYGRTWNQRLADCGYDPYWAQAGGESFANFQSASAAF
ncbi:MAG TPA: hypothetical protein VFK32_05555, partial [Tepidiformaceae bacterium]|nr:hypothetical protein [Tepidiformaceae bacterium]